MSKLNSPNTPETDSSTSPTRWGADLTVLFIGSNPSASAKTYNPFHESTKSGSILVSWIRETCPHSRQVSCNVSDNPTEANRPLTVAEIKANLPRLLDKIKNTNPDRVVALGKTAEKALTLLRIPHYAMPHPSGLNRLLNDPLYVAEKIKGLREYLKPSKSDVPN